jgi:alanine dehydrogenase
MKIGVPKEIKTNENRIALVPAGAESLVAAGHSVLIETNGGVGSGFPDEAYTAVGAQIAPDAATVWRETDMIMKVKEPIEREWPHMRRGQLIFTYFHFAADEKLTKAHLASGATCVAYETVELPSRELPRAQFLVAPEDIALGMIPFGQQAVRETHGLHRFAVVNRADLDPCLPVEFVQNWFGIDLVLGSVDNHDVRAFAFYACDKRKN